MYATRVQHVFFTFPKRKKHFKQKKKNHNIIAGDGWRDRRCNIWLSCWSRRVHVWAKVCVCVRACMCAMCSSGVPDREGWMNTHTHTSSRSGGHWHGTNCPCGARGPCQIRNGGDARRIITPSFIFVRNNHSESPRFVSCDVYFYLYASAALSSFPFHPKPD